MKFTPCKNQGKNIFVTRSKYQLQKIINKYFKSFEFHVELIILLSHNLHANFNCYIFFCKFVKKELFVPYLKKFKSLKKSIFLNLNFFCLTLRK